MSNDYESLRESNIERNKRFLQEIGLDRNVVHESTRQQEKTKVKRKRKASGEQNIDSRRSSRIAMLPAPSYKEDATVNSKSANSTLDYSEYNVNESDDSVGQGQVWPERTSSITQSVAPDPSKSSGCSMNLDAFYAKLGEPLDVFGKAHVMALANGGKLPRFSKYSGVAPWANGYFLWVNIDIDEKTGRSKNDYPNVFLDGGERMTWFGGSNMHPESPVIHGLLKAGRSDVVLKGDDVGKEGVVVVFVREVKLPYCCFGRVEIDDVDLTKRPVRVTWKFLDYHTHLTSSRNFKNIVKIAS